VINTNTTKIKEYWELRFEKFSINHSDQNKNIIKDFIKKSIEVYQFDLALNSNICKKIIEIGCGTGELSCALSANVNERNVVGIDISEKAIKFANENYSNKQVKYVQFNCLEKSILDSFGEFDLSISSNTLEHFKDPFSIFSEMQKCSKYSIIIVPYKQPCKDGYSAEGGPGHVFTFDDKTFEKFKVISTFTFQTNGWQHNSFGETPLQIAYLIES
jgi:2-polyprenyl-3-methyl-5-hydroxy-6-metoxy-1,4-benzoquinol methylase